MPWAVGVNGEFEDPRRRWDGRLEEWLEAVDIDLDENLISWQFPTDGLSEEYLRTVHQRSEQDVRGLIESFCIKSGGLGCDEQLLAEHEWQMANNAVVDVNHMFMARLSRHAVFPKWPPPWEGITWILDLLPDSPLEAIQAVQSYQRAHAQIIPDGRYYGVSDACAIIRARWIDNAPGAEPFGELVVMNPREFEELIAALYHKMGYHVTLTSASRDGGRDVIAKHDTAGQRARLLIECKRYQNPVGVERIRTLLGVVSNDRATKGVLATTDRFTRGARLLAAENSRIELLDGHELSVLLNQSFGPSWHYRIDHITSSWRKMFGS